MTYGMKVAVSIPDPVFAEAEALAKRMKLSRSKLYAKALDAFVAENTNDDLTAVANALAEMNEDVDLALFRRASARNVIKNSEW
jgi:metal-responsive CopG/Arc/MetJ family transcriptional regulator